MLANTTSRGDIQITSSTTIQFAATADLASRPIRLWALSGRQAALTSLPTALTISGTAGTRYVYASLAAPTGSPYSTASGGLLDRILSFASWNRSDWVNGFRAFHPGDGSLIDSARNSTVTFVETNSATPPDTHHVILGRFDCAGGVITGITSYESAVDITVSSFIHGQCRLVLSGANLVLLPYNGSNIVINGTARSIAAGGASLAPTGLSTGTLYYIYATWSGSAVAIESSTTANTTDTNGVEIKTADSTRTLVGWAWIVAGPAWSDVAPPYSWFNTSLPNTLVKVTGNPYKTVASTNAETSIFTATPKIKANTASTARKLYLQANGDTLVNNGGSSSVWRIKLGSTVVATLSSNSQDPSTSATRYVWRIDAELIPVAASVWLVTAQVVQGASTPGVSGTVATTIFTNGALSGHNNVTEDQTTDLAFDFTIQPEFNSANHSIRLHDLHLWVSPWP